MSRRGLPPLVGSVLQSLTGGLRLLLLRPLAGRIALRPAWHFWPLFGLQVALSLLLERYWAQDWQRFGPDGLQSDAFVALLLLAAAQLSVWLLRKPVLLWSLVVWWMSASLWLGVLWALVETVLWWQGWLQLPIGKLCLGLFIAWWWLALAHSLSQLMPERSRWPRLGTALAAAALSALPVFALQLSTYQRPVPWTGADLQNLPPAPQPPWPLPRTPEQLLVSQPEQVRAQLDTLRRQDPERLDAYLLAFGSDGNEQVFANEVGYVQRLFDQRFGTDGRSLALLNDPDSTERQPLASLSNLRQALQGLGRILDPEQDLLILFLTSHGSEDHRLYVDLLQLPLDQIDPQQLRAALDDSGIRWKVVIVSACYSGGFIEALSDPTTLVLTAARDDRSSFGCGPDSDFTYFGRAYFINALNQTIDLIQAFGQAREEIAAREAEEERPPSEPQIASNPLIEAVLAQWQAGLQPGPPLPWPMPDSPAAPEAPAASVRKP